MIKAIALDLDGTLLNDKKEITEENQKVLQELNKLGYEIVIATGRAYSATKNLVKNLDIPLDIVCYNGAKIVSLKDDKVIFEEPLDEEIVKKLVNLSHETKTHLNLYQDEIWYVENDLNWETEYYSKSIGMNAIKKDFETFKDFKMTKALFIDKNKKLKELEIKLNDLFGKNVYMAFSQEKYLEVLNKNVNKAKTLEKVLNNKNILMSECIAFGDAENDIEMIESVGYGVAMGNATEKVKKVAKYIADTNLESGVGRFLNKLILEK